MHERVGLVGQKVGVVREQGPGTDRAGEFLDEAGIHSRSISLVNRLGVAGSTYLASLCSTTSSTLWLVRSSSALMARRTCTSLEKRRTTKRSDAFLVRNVTQWRKP